MFSDMQPSDCQKELDAADITRGSKVLDFGAGIGRGALPRHYNTGLPSHACDINGVAMA
jgi:cyclopropane fatty-acyl-phospholipid synthase-like methyltransferase